ncbi:FAD-binding monooxygenase [Streptomyces sp. SID4919]|uniref:FAD-dependent monooxygenase n=1 Tax=unclassified Streptomyces TaxID=2593676 RepID=UPI000C0853E6|nr:MULTISPECIES: FAD-dependent monooxygenase [unclassified Streptomyces]MYY12228.1 FAD-binding monooxygenase [Streptomyces sp. SID4919]
MGARVKVACVGGGPAGLYFSILMKRQDPSHDITVHERNPAGSTYGWGVTYWSALLERLRAGDPESARAIAEHSVSWHQGVARVGDFTTVQPGDEGFGIGRRTMLGLLTERARALGVRVVFEDEVGEPPPADLVVAGDGVNSVLRDRHRDHFGTEVTAGRNVYAWLGTTKVFPSFTFAFVPTEHGWIWAYGYPFDAGRSTCVVECSPATWRGLGLDRADEAEGLNTLEKLFADGLDGHGLIGREQQDGTARWLTFRTVTNRAWYRDNLVLLGDAAHTTHYSIGAGTTLALEDAMALAAALRGSPELRPALARYERERRSALLSAQSAARYSAEWYENLPRYMRLPPERMFALLGQRHSPLLPHVPPGLYYRLDRAAGRLESARRFKRWLGPRVARTLHARSRPR